ncbi:MAG: hypothetical protein V3V62_01370 [bacterium]
MRIDRMEEREFDAVVVGGGLARTCRRGRGPGRVASSLALLSLLFISAHCGYKGKRAADAALRTAAHLDTLLTPSRR